MSLVEINELSVRYGGVRALDAANARIDAGSVVGLIGPNGAGKTTLIDALTGFTPTFSGNVVFAGEDITRLPVHERARRGLRRTFQSLELFNDLSLRENLLVAVEKDTWWASLADAVHPARRGCDPEVVDAALDRLGLLEIGEARPDELSYGQQKLVAVARMVVAQPRVALLDEPAAGLHTSESTALGRHLRSMIDGSSTAMLLVDHDMGLVLSVCDWIYVLDFGRIIAEGTPQAVRSDPHVIEAYLGTDEPAAGEPA